MAIIALIIIESRYFHIVICSSHIHFHYDHILPRHLAK